MSDMHEHITSIHTVHDDILSVIISHESFRCYSPTGQHSNKIPDWSTSTSDDMEVASFWFSFLTEC